MTWRNKLQRVLRPWPSRAERQAGLKAAAEEKAASAKRTIHARQVAQSIEDLVYRQNNFARLVADGLGIHNGDKNGDRKK